MSDAVYKIIELAGSSKTSIEDAVQNALDRASKSVRDLCWFTVLETRGYIDGDRISYWQVVVKLGFNIDATEAPQKSESPEKSKEEKDKSGRSENGSKGGSKYRCTVCGYVYDPQKGDPANGAKPGTSFEDLPDDWKCPECGVGKDKFEKI